MASLTAAMQIARKSPSGIALGAWGAVQATASGVAIASSGAIRDFVSRLAADGSLGPALSGPNVGYDSVYAIEILLLFATLAAVGSLVRTRLGHANPLPEKFGLAEFPS